MHNILLQDMDHERLSYTQCIPDPPYTGPPYKQETLLLCCRHDLLLPSRSASGCTVNGWHSPTRSSRDIEASLFCRRSPGDQVETRVRTLAHRGSFFVKHVPRIDFGCIRHGEISNVRENMPRFFLVSGISHGRDFEENANLFLPSSVRRTPTVFQTVKKSIFK